jgi:hypothetical protein
MKSGRFFFHLFCRTTPGTTSMAGHLFIACGDLTDLVADAIAYSTSTHLGGSGHLTTAFERCVPGFAAILDAVRAQSGGSVKPGQAFWRRLSGDGIQPRGVVVVAATGGGSSSSDEARDVGARLAVRNAVAAAVDGIRTDFPEVKRPLIALPAFRHGRGGDRRRMLRSALVQVEEARDALERHRDIDLAFVLYTEENYRVYLQARRRVFGSPRFPFTDPEQERLVCGRLVPALRDQRGVLFVGAGLSQGAGLDAWHPLIERLAGGLQYRLPQHFDLDLSLQLAQWYVEEHGRDALTALIRQDYGGLDDPLRRPGIRPTLAHYLLLALPLRMVVTTNYDALLERTLRALRRDPQVIVESSHVVAVGQSDPLPVVKFHGDAESGRNIILTEHDYDTFFESHPVLSLLLEGFLLHHTFLFAGYRLRDPNFRHLYGRVARMLAGADRHAFSLDVGTPNPYAVRSWREQRLHLLQLEGLDLPERVRQSWLFLDWLADRLVSGDVAGVPVEENATVPSLPPGLFLLENVHVSGPLEPLRRVLLDQVGAMVEQLAPQGRRSPDEARTLAQVLECLTRLGWRARARGLEISELWEWLAGSIDQQAEARRLLRRALRHTQNLQQADHLRELLAGTEGEPSSPESK